MFNCKASLQIQLLRQLIGNKENRQRKNKKNFNFAKLKPYSISTLHVSLLEMDHDFAFNMIKLIYIN